MLWCRTPYEKCVCFIFLVVVLAILSCSGFRIDNFAIMTDTNKRNYSNTNQHHQVLEPVREDPAHHRLRHQRHSAPLGRRKPRARPCVPHEAGCKAYWAGAVVLAHVESMSTSTDPKDNFTVLFKVLERIKNSSFPVDDQVRLQFTRDKDAAVSVVTNATCSHRGDGRSKRLVKANIEQSKKYILFLDACGAHNYYAVYSPERLGRNKNNLKVVRKVARPSFKTEQVVLELDVKSGPKGGKKDEIRLKLVCRVTKGRPIPVIHWKLNGATLHHNPPSVQIFSNNKKKKKRSTLIIKGTEVYGQFRCSAQGVLGEESVSRPHTLFRPGQTPCDFPHNSSFCENGGTCFKDSLTEIGCECLEGYTGQRCHHKTSDQSSTYHQDPIYTCENGLYTNYNNCTGSVVH